MSETTRGGSIIRFFATMNFIFLLYVSHQSPSYLGLIQCNLPTRCTHPRIFDLNPNNSEWSNHPWVVLEQGSQSMPGSELPQLQLKVMRDLLHTISLPPTGRVRTSSQGLSPHFFPIFTATGSERGRIRRESWIPRNYAAHNHVNFWDRKGDQISSTHAGDSGGSSYDQL